MQISLSRNSKWNAFYCSENFLKVMRCAFCTMMGHNLEKAKEKNHSTLVIVFQFLISQIDLRDLNSYVFIYYRAFVFRSEIEYPDSVLIYFFL